MNKLTMAFNIIIFRMGCINSRCKDRNNSRGSLVSSNSNEPNTTGASQAELTEPNTTGASQAEVTEPNTTGASQVEVTEPNTTGASQVEVTDIILEDDKTIAGSSGSRPEDVSRVTNIHLDANTLPTAALHSSNLKDKDISQVTEIVSAKNRFRFSIKFLEINPNEYHTIESEANFIHHDTLFECIRRWKNRTEAEGNNAKDELIRILMGIRQEHGWFPGNAMAFLTDVTGLQIPQDSEYTVHF